MAVLKITKDNFEALKKSGKTVLIDFSAQWCGPCRLVAPVIEEIGSEHPEFIVGKADVDEEPELSVRFGVMNIPTLVVLKEGRVTATAVGVRKKEEILAMLSGE